MVIALLAGFGLVSMGSYDTPSDKTKSQSAQRIGNQLFKNATARKLSLKLKRSLVIDHQSEFRRDYVYKRDYQLNILVAF